MKRRKPNPTLKSECSSTGEEKKIVVEFEWPIFRIGERLWCVRNNSDCNKQACTMLLPTSDFELLALVYIGKCCNQTEFRVMKWLTEVKCDSLLQGLILVFFLSSSSFLFFLSFPWHYTPSCDLVSFNRTKVLNLVIQSERFVMKQTEPSGDTRENTGPCPLR